MPNDSNRISLLDDQALGVLGQMIVIVFEDFSQEKEFGFSDSFNDILP